MHGAIFIRFQREVTFFATNTELGVCVWAAVDYRLVAVRLSTLSRKYGRENKVHFPLVSKFRITLKLESDLGIWDMLHPHL